MNQDSQTSKDATRRVGLSLRLPYVAGSEGGFRDILGDPVPLLAELKAAGLAPIEIQGLPPTLQSDILVGALERVYEAGLGITFHSQLPAWELGQPLPKFHEPSPAVVAALQRFGTIIPAVVHAYTSREQDWDLLVKRSIEAIRAMATFYKTHDVPLRVALEINRFKGAVTPDVRYEGILEMADSFEEDELGLCWDMGHTQSSIMQRQLPIVPPQDFVNQVIHTHMHDIGENGRTHFPLVSACDHLKNGIQRLTASGYSGVYNLELYPDRWGMENNADIKAAIFASIERLINL